MKKFVKILFGVLMIGLLMTPVAASANYNGHTLPDVANATNVHKKIVAYFADWDIYARGYQAADIDASKITDLNYAFAAIKDGIMVPADSWADINDPYLKGLTNSKMKGSFGQLIQLKKKYPNLKTIISVGGWSGSGQFSNVALTNESRTKFADSIVQFLRSYQFDGVDLDWEYPVSGGLSTNVTRHSDKQNYTLLLKTIREKLDKAGKQDHKKYLLTIAGAANSSFIKNTELKKIGKIVDWINLMTYDFHVSSEPQSGNNAPLYSSSSDPASHELNANWAVNAYIKAGVNTKKVVLGIPFYGKGWTGCNVTNNGEFQQCSGPSKSGTWAPASYDFTDLQNNYINKNGFQSYWDNQEKVPYLYNDATGTYITYDNAESIGYKANYINTHHLGGAMIWEISDDRNETLLTPLAAKLLK